MNAVLRKAWADERRRWVQSLVIAGMVLLASGTMTIGLTLLQEAADPFDRAFDAQKGAHLQVRYSSTKIAQGQLPSTAAVLGARWSAGPWPVVTVTVKHGAARYTLNLVGRESPGGPVGKLELVAGRWLEGPGEVVVPRSFAEFNRVSIGDQLITLHTADKPSLTIVGEAVDIDQGAADLGNSQWAWATRDQVQALADPALQGDDLTYLMLYRYAGTPTPADLSLAENRLQASLPTGAVAASLNYTLVKTVFRTPSLIFEIVLTAFSLLALIAGLATVANLVIGIVISSYREIGIMKAVGFTPNQVIASLETQMLIPSLAGCTVGVPVGMVLSLPLVGLAARSLSIPSNVGPSPVAGLAALAAVLVAVAVSAYLPARRAGRLSAVTAMAVGSAPRAHEPAWLLAQIHRSRLPLSIRLGLELAFLRRGRALLAILAVVLGVATLVFAFGGVAYLSTLNLSTNVHAGEIVVQRAASYPTDQAIIAAIQARPETLAILTTGTLRVDVPGISDPVLATAFRGDATGRTPLVAGRWFTGPNEVVAPRAVLNDAHLKIGDSFNVTVGGRQVPLHLVGEALGFLNLGRQLFFDWSTYLQMTSTPQPQVYVVTLRPGSDAQVVARAIQALEPDALNVSVSEPRQASILQVFNVVIEALAALMGLVAAAGVYVTMLLNTQERFRELGILRSLGLAPRAVTRVVISSAAAPGLIGGLLGLPAGAALFYLVFSIGAQQGGNDLPPNALNSVFTPGLPLFALAGAAIACVGAALPGKWAGQGVIAEVLRSE